MTRADFENILFGILNPSSPEVAENASNAMTNFIQNPNSIGAILDVIHHPHDENQLKQAVTFLVRYSKFHYNKLDSQAQELLYQEILKLTFHSNYLIGGITVDLLIKLSKNNDSRVKFLLNQIVNCFNTNSNVKIALEAIHSLIDELDIGFVRSIANQLLDYANKGIQTNDWEIIILSMRLLFNASAALEQPDLNQQILLLLNQSDNLPNNDESIFSQFWSIFGDAINCELVPSGLYEMFYSKAMSALSNRNISSHLKKYVLNSLSGLVKFLSVDMVSEIMEIAFVLAVETVKEDDILPTDNFDLIQRFLTKLPPDEIYLMLKNKIEYLIHLNNREANVVAISLFSIILQVAQSSASKDVDYIIKSLMEALDKNDALLNSAVCKVLQSFEFSFHAVDLFTIQFIPRIIPFIVSPNSDLRTEAHRALHTLCGLINIPLHGFFNMLWQIQGNIYKEDINDYLQYLATAIEKSEDFSDEDCQNLLQFIIPHLQSQNIEESSGFLIIASTLMIMNEAAISPLIELCANVVQQTLFDENPSEDSLCNALDFLNSIFDNFGSTYNKHFNNSFEHVLKILNDDSTSQRVMGFAMSVASSFAKATSNVEIAHILKEKCFACFIGEREEEDEDINESEDEGEYQLVKTGTECGVKIAKLLTPDDSYQLFLQVKEYMVASENPEIVSEALKLFTKLIHHSKVEYKANYLKVCEQFFNDVISGNLPFLEDDGIFSPNCDYFLITNIAYLIAEVVHYSSGLVNILCEFMIKMIKNPNCIALYAFIGAYSDVIKYGTGSPEAIQAIFELIPSLLENANDPDTKHNLSFLLNIIVQKNPSSIQGVKEYISILQKWYEQGKESPNGHQIMFANIASAYLTFFANGLPLNMNYLNEAICEFPPFDRLETPSMIKNMAVIFSKYHDFTEEVIINAALSLSKVFLYNESKQKEMKITPDLLECCRNMLVAISNTNPKVRESLIQKYNHSQVKLSKILSVLE